MQVFERVEKWKREHRKEWKEIEKTLKLLDELGLRRKFGPEPLIPGYNYDIEASDSKSYSFEL
ncbi:hypothetical protein [Archaeoglobus profundus]|uniref:Uncharacterized protein n=1 Tax=Archaeoglobus profundus (strain DSM 5631 / JCM 9629 / NBRC 100127 / Av18) TaxID=572546 RepID=D2REN0_ARCPA|nr:hypothetical protein [Archaeoglobus profundus]ADB58574.1 hypothetical protein Arcpr_1528 [Archaeoglobus profundus DSM 5631]